MNKLSPEKFLDLLAVRQDAIDKTLAQKAIEYSFDGDRLYNFNRAAQVNGTTAKKALWGMATKHLISVQDLVEGRLANTANNVNEKVGDMINYLILLEGTLSIERESEYSIGCTVIQKSSERSTHNG